MMTDRLRLILALAAEPDRQRREHLAAELIESLFNEGAAAATAAVAPPLIDTPDGPMRITLAADEPTPATTFAGETATPPEHVEDAAHASGFADALRTEGAAQPESAAEPVQAAAAATDPPDPFGAALAASGGAPAPVADAEPAAAPQGDGDPSALDRNPFE